MRLVRRRTLLGAALLAGCATPAPEQVRVVRVAARDSVSFNRQPDGSWVELSHQGLARFRFTHEREENDVTIVNDETRNVRLRIDPHARAITEETSSGWRPLYEISGVERGPTLGVSPAGSTEGVTRVWFVGGGAGVRDGAVWREISKEDGFPLAHEWREESRDDDTLVLRDEARQALARVELSEGAVYFQTIGEAAPRLRVGIRAVDYW